MIFLMVKLEDKWVIALKRAGELPFNLGLALCRLRQLIDRCIDCRKHIKAQEAKPQLSCCQVWQWNRWCHVRGNLIPQGFPFSDYDAVAVFAIIRDYQDFSR